ncbi:pyridoxal-phosphate dependent enzyme [Streptomyces ficellus]|uniref:Pyridoxal-phosphate dependent enzyme n=1 Tax=Streptomyces ficellus TaxID=1977088 RepID=A0ABT7ZFC9_9ACTN|nr:pyridoxal-phosphate dependent enzyme [Streptomyces ficellus]MDN3297731.1 pyridoxal-phosphate dependent enzyme [Streptomyces ficellus]
MTAHPAVSLARSQRSLGDPGLRYPLHPPLLRGCPRTATADMVYPVEVDYAYEDTPADLFTRPMGGGGLERWAPLLPPLDAPGLGEGGTALVPLGDGLWIKDESRNPTWSHKDRLNRVAVSAAVRVGAKGIAVASSGNHGASAAAYAARAGLRCVVLTSAGTPPAVASFLQAYGADVFAVPQEARWPLLAEIGDRLGYHTVSNLTRTHTGHPFGPEGYKTIAYEIHGELGVPAAVFVPTGYGELLFGVWKGFRELRDLGVTDTVPPVFGCEPATGGPLAAAIRTRAPAAVIEVGTTGAYAIDCAAGGNRAVRAVRDSGGDALLVTDEELTRARDELAGQGVWAELSAAAGLAGFRQWAAREGDVDGPVVCVSTSSGFKDLGVGGTPLQPIEPTWEAVSRALGRA